MDDVKRIKIDKVAPVAPNRMMLLIVMYCIIKIPFPLTIDDCIHMVFYIYHFKLK